MLSIGKAIVSMDLFEKKFICDLDKCKGYCCVDGESGAPLNELEVELLEDVYPLIQSYMRPEGVIAVEKQGTSVIDADGDMVTPLIGVAECVYTFIENGIFKCAIEKAWYDKKIDFRKPESCHLFPVRVKSYKEFDAVNYQELKICKPALAKGEAEGVYVFSFLKEPLTRLYGKEWYKELSIAAKEIEKRKKK